MLTRPGSILALPGGMILLIAAALAIAWVLGFVVFHVSAFAIHLLLAAAVVAIVLHFMRGRSAPA